ncbi:MAG: class I SAM-dependent methyltransferase [candidate division Zixibacteria bacterium]
MTEDKRNPGAIDYFHRRIQDFDDIYRDDKPGLGNFLNKTIRASVRIRFDLAFEMLGDLTGKKVLDIGCGSGRYMFESVKRGASFVSGLDAADGALDFARKIARDFNVSDQVEFVNVDFLDYSSEGKFDVIFAVGYFDYIFESALHLAKMLELSNGIIYASFPKRWSILSAIRKVRLALNGCPVRYYTKKNIRKLMNEIGCDNFEIKTIFRDNILIIRK